MLLQRQHFLLSYLKTLSVGPAGVWSTASSSADRRLSHWGSKLFYGSMHGDLESALIFLYQYLDQCEKETEYIFFSHYTNRLYILLYLTPIS